jgi:hypothetical protein
VLAAVAGLILLQSTGGLFQTYLRKIDTGAFMIMNERVQAHLDARFRQSDIVYFGQPALPWWPSARGNRFLGLAANDGGLVARIDDVAAQATRGTTRAGRSSRRSPCLPTATAAGLD